MRGARRSHNTIARTADRHPQSAARPASRTQSRSINGGADRSIANAEGARLRPADPNGSQPCLTPAIAASPARPPTRKHGLLERNLDLEHASYFVSCITITATDAARMSSCRKRLFIAWHATRPARSSTTVCPVNGLWPSARRSRSSGVDTAGRPRWSHEVAARIPAGRPRGSPGPQRKGAGRRPCAGPPNDRCLLTGAAGRRRSAAAPSMRRSSRPLQRFVRRGGGTRCQRGAGSR
jgi:hypothetical protein